MKLQERRENVRRQAVLGEQYMEKECRKYTSYERAMIIGARALQISRGASLMLKTELKDPLKIAKEEFEKGVIQIDVKRQGDLK